MRRQTESTVAGGNSVNSNTDNRTKKLYQPPRLAVYGDLHKLTAGGNMSGSEGSGAGPSTKH